MVVSRCVFGSEMAGVADGLLKQRFKTEIDIKSQRLQMNLSEF
jgi:hypothetical protein